VRSAPVCINAAFYSQNLLIECIIFTDMNRDEGSRRVNVLEVPWTCIPRKLESLGASWILLV
jgi:hypothetical protein